MIPINTQKNNEKKMLKHQIRELEEKEKKSFSEQIELKQLKNKLYRKYSKVE